MKMTDFRAELQLLFDDAESFAEIGHHHLWVAALHRASAALAEQPVVPTDEEIMELMPQQMRDDLAAAARAMAGSDRPNFKSAGAMRIILNRHAVDHARAVLARWGQP
jgi:hypothetical protein